MKQLHNSELVHFGSDNYAGAHPEVLEALSIASGGHVPGYGADPYTERLREWARETFGPDALIFPVFNGTGANVVSLAALNPRWGHVIAAPSAHINTDETAAPESSAGLKVKPAPAIDGKLTPEAVTSTLSSRDFVHEAQTTSVSVSNSTELGTVYQVEEFRAIAEVAHTSGLSVHLDGSRLACAAAATGVGLEELTRGADVISLGATKNGALGAEAVVVRNPKAVSGIQYLNKSLLQLPSKARFISAQLLALFDGDLWLRNAEHANAQAAKLAKGLMDAGFDVPVTTQANAVIASVEPEIVERVLAQGVIFYAWPFAENGIRLMTAWDTPDSAVDELISTFVAARG